MYFRKKVRNRIIVGVVIILAFIFWRGLKITTEEKYDCEYKVIYAFCVSQVKNAKPPGLFSIIKAGVRFNIKD